eukprot:s1533_g18.t1
MNGLNLSVCVIDSWQVLEERLEVEDAVSELQNLGLRVILVNGHDHEGASSSASTLRRYQPRMLDGFEVMRVAFRNNCSYAIPKHLDELPYTLAPRHRRWVEQHRDFLEVRFSGETGSFKARFPHAMKAQWKSPLPSQIPEQPQLFKEPLDWESGDAIILTVSRGRRREHLLCISECSNSLLQCAAQHAGYILCTQGGDSWKESDDDLFISKALLAVGGFWATDRFMLLTAVCGPHAGTRSLGIGSNIKKRRRAATLALAATAFAQWGSEEPLPQSDGEFEALALALRTALANQKVVDPCGWGMGCVEALFAVGTWVLELPLQTEYSVAIPDKQCHHAAICITKTATVEVSKENRSAGHLGTPVPVSDLFQRAEAESRVVNSALSSWLVSVACALIALGIFTQSLWLSVRGPWIEKTPLPTEGIACFAMLSTAACSLFFITSVFHWSFGLMEAVSLIIFCGFSVDYPLHVVQAYVHERQRGVDQWPGERQVHFSGELDQKG